MTQYDQNDFNRRKLSLGQLGAGIFGLAGGWIRIYPRRMDQTNFHHEDGILKFNNQSTKTPGASSQWENR